MKKASAVLAIGIILSLAPALAAGDNLPFDRAQRAMKLRDYPAAITICLGLLEASPGDYDVNFLLAQAYARSGDRVAIVEDDEPVRASLGVLINGASGFACVCSCATAEEALARIPPLKPDVVLMDINLPGISGIECVRRLKEMLPETNVLMLTVYEESDLIFDSLRRGATGYLLKEISIDEVATAIRAVAGGQSLISPSMASKLISEFAQLVKRDDDRQQQQQRDHRAIPRLRRRRLLRRGLFGPANASTKIFQTDSRRPIR